MNQLTTTDIVKTLDIAEPTSNGELITPEQANAVIANFAAIKDGSSSTDHAAKCTEVLLGSYPGREVNDPQIYVRAITSILVEYHPKVSKQAVDYVTRNCKFMPTRAEVEEACQTIYRTVGRNALVAKRHLREIERREKEVARDREISESWGSDEERETKLAGLMSQVNGKCNKGDG